MHMFYLMAMNIPFYAKLEKKTDTGCAGVGKTIRTQWDWPI